MTMPPIIATSVSWTEKTRPFQMKLVTRFQFRKPKSRLVIGPPAEPSQGGSTPPRGAGAKRRGGASSAGPDHARHLDALLDQQRQAVDRERRHEVQERHREVDLDAARGLLGGLLREESQLGDADRERHRRVLDDVHRFAGQRLVYE